MKNHLKKLFNPKTAILLVGLLVVVELTILLLPYVKQSAVKSLPEYADQVVAECASTRHRPTCYEEKVPELMDYISMEDAFQVTRIIQEKDRSFNYCHVLGHELSAREVRKNPSAWKDVVTRAPSGMCSNGGIHGAFQEKFRAEYLSDEELEQYKPDFYDICEKRGGWSPTGLEQASCYHALGHLAMYVTNADLDKSVSLCQEMAIKPDGRNFEAVCYDGVFMQINQPLEPEDFALIEGKEIKKEDLYTFCSKYEGAMRGSCWAEGWPLFRSELQKPQGLTEFCGKTIESERWRCFEGLIYVMTAQMNLDEKRVVPYCSGLVGDRRSQCLSAAASRYIEIDYRNMPAAVSLCEAGQSIDPKNSCLNKLLDYTFYNYHRDSQAFIDACQTLPVGWKEKCS
jgi:hypothetical protein